MSKRNYKLNNSSSSSKNVMMLEKTIFCITRVLTYFILFCACFIFWDIISKGSRKVFHKEGFINWEFFTESPQTLHVIEHDGETLELSSENYFSFKRSLSDAAWKLLITKSQFKEVKERLVNNLNDFTETPSPSSEKNLLHDYIENEKKEAKEKFNFWLDMLENASNHASDFEVSEEEIPYLVGRFIIAFLNQAKSKYKLLDNELSYFSALHYPKIDNLTPTNIEDINLAYFNFLNENLPKLWNVFEAKNKNLRERVVEFDENPSTSSFVFLENNFKSIDEVQSLHEFNSSDLLKKISDDLRWIASSFRISVDSKDYAYSGGGIFPAIAGTLLLVGGAMLIALIIGVCCAVFLSEYGKTGKFLSLVRLSILNLAGVPSIIFGLFGMGLFVIFLDWNVSLIAGWFTLAFMVLPIIITASEESLRAIPQDFRESSIALGASKWTMIKTSVLPYALPGILTSSILGVARVAGETAPIMFTAAFAMRSELPWEGLEKWTDFFFQGVMALPYHIYVISKIPQNEYTIDMQYGTAFVFLMLVFMLASLSFVLRARLRRKFNW